MESFNSYKEGLDLAFLKRRCVEHGRLVQFARGDLFEKAGCPSRLVGYVVKGCFKYNVQVGGGKNFVTGFAFEGEFVADYPNCLYGRRSEVSIEANMPCEVYVIDGRDLLQMYLGDDEVHLQGRLIAENLFTQTYSRFLDHYRYDARERYERLLARCPLIVQQLSLRDIASFLNVTPKTISQIRRDITFEVNDG